jgi:KipI family sensor histidine kinase inhibitor
VNAVRVRPVGDAAVSVEFGRDLDPALAARVRALDAQLAVAPLDGVCETVPTCRALLVVYDPRAIGFDALRDELLRRAAAAAAGVVSGTTHVIPVRYGGDDGPDLAGVARACGLSEATVVARHSAVEYEALMLGFLPGFAYLGLLPPELELPRRATPRPRVPAGSVAVAGRQTGIYPSDSPGGWHLIGRTGVRLFDPALDPPARVRAGDRVRFVPVDTLERDAAAPQRAEPSVSGATLEVLDGGWRTSVQDAGRFGRRRYGVAWSGALDAASYAAANAAVGNPPGAAGLECALAGPRLRFLAPAVFAVCGGDLGARLERADLAAPWPVLPGVAVRARSGNVLSFAGRRSGCRAYVAFAGGLDVPLALGARATDLTAGFGGLAGRALRAGDRLRVATENRREPAASRPHAWAGGGEVSVRVVLGPQDDHFDARARAALFDAAWSVSATSDRVGCRLVGPRLAHAGPSEIVSDGMVPGCIQVPPDGQPIVSLADGPTTGGYPKIATVVADDLPRLAQLVPGEGHVRFVAVPGQCVT